MEVPQSVRDKLLSLDRTRFEKIKDSEFRPPYTLIGLKYLRGKAGNERDLRELYRGRAPYELLQNADDAGAKKVTFILSRDGLVFAHDGRWFTVDNFRNLADGWSDKDPSQCIGHKGLGFRSVLDITPAPYLVKIDEGQFFAVKFTWALNNGHIQETLRRDSALRTHYEKWTRHGQLACPVMAIPGLAKKHNLGEGSTIFDRLVRGSYGSQFTTMFWFPARDSDINRKVLEELSPTPITADSRGRQVLLGFLKDEVSVLLPFLASVEEVVVYDNNRRIGLARISRGPEEQEEREVTVHTEIGEQSCSESFFQMQFTFQIPPGILNRPDTPKAVRAMRERGVKVVLSARLEDSQPVCDDESCFHVYFPTAESTGVGFVVHGDFYVKPDRTRLMPGAYNEWLLGRAANAAASEFLTCLLERYNPRSVFAALSPTGSAAKSAAETFVSLFSKELRERAEPFVPTDAGLLKREEVVLPPTIDKSGFWDSHFSDVVSDVLEGRKAFLAHNEDGKGTRAFLHLAQVHVLKPETLLALIEVSAQQTRPPGWWYECCSYVANDEKLSRCDHSFFVGHKLIPTTDSSIIAVPGDDSSLVVCLPPAGDASVLHVPDCFSSVFVFLDQELATLLEEGKDTVRSWVLDRFRIARFEATELLPRAIRGVVTQLFSGELRVSPVELRQAWSFIKKIIDVSRTILSPTFWQEVGRFPLPLDTTAPGGNLRPESLVPAFLAYWPDSFAEGEHSLSDIESFRRIDEEFLNELVAKGGSSRSGWTEFFRNVGVSATPKLLVYRRIVARGRDLPFVSDAPSEYGAKGFSGERQSDENRTVVEALREENLLDSTVEGAAPCGHDSPRVLRSLTLLAGLGLCTQVAEQEHQTGDSKWHQRLWSLVRDLPLSSVDELNDDEAFCRGGGPGGHSVTAGSYIRRQLDHYRWLPSSQGPMSSPECFLRRSSRRLISSGRADEELGDKLLPYVVVDSVDDLARLRHLGVEELDDAASASPSALMRALASLGEQLSTEWGQKEILEERSRWRLVRGALQEIYRSLNQSGEALDCPSDIKFATRSDGGVEFHSSPLYYAEPGSTVEQAFLNTLPLFDADRPYPRLFDQIGVTRLIAGETVDEMFLAEDSAVPAQGLHGEITDQLAPYLLAPIIAKSDRSNQSETVVRRLRERFEVKAADHLTVSYSFTGSSPVERTIEFPKFCLQRRLLPGLGAIREAHYTLYVAGSASVSLSNLDLDADALGEALSPVFLGGIGEELAGLFPRIASRYHHLRGRRDAMEEFLYYQLGISREAQDMAWAMVSGEGTEAPAALPPPPAKIICRRTPDADTHLDDRKNLEKTIQDHQDKINKETNHLMRGLVGPPEKQPQEPTTDSDTTPSVRSRKITPEQQARGKRGEEEIKRRLERPGGWEGFTLLDDTRDRGCGYDFLCAAGEHKVKLEVKTFAQDGQVFVTSTELQEAAASKDDYYLIGVLDDGKPEHEWFTIIVPDPIGILLTKGMFDIQATLKASATDIFGLGENY